MVLAMTDMYQSDIGLVHRLKSVSKPILVGTRIKSLQKYIFRRDNGYIG